MNNPEAQTEQLVPLHELKINAEVRGVIAQVSAQQVFVNKAENCIEAEYVFPLPEGSAVTACTMRIGQNLVVAELQDAQEAREVYDNAVAGGHSAALAEQKRSNIFRMSVGGIEPGQEIRVELNYIQQVDWQDGGGRFVIPLVLAPRFIQGEPIAKKGSGWGFDTDLVPDASEITPIVWSGGVPYKAEVNLTVNPGFKSLLSSPSHTLDGRSELNSSEEASYKLSDLTADRDLVLMYKNIEDRPTASYFYTRFQGKYYVCLHVFPQGSVEDEEKATWLTLDISSSMDGTKIEGLKSVASSVVEKLRAQQVSNKVGVLAFESSPRVVHGLDEIGEGTFRAISSLTPRGGTMTGVALDLAAKSFGSLKAQKRILLVTDGQTTNFPTHDFQDIRVIAVGIDAAMNLDYLKDVAKRSGGVNYAVYPGEDIENVARNLTGFLSGPVVCGLKVKADRRQVGNVLGVSDVFSGMPATLFFETDELPNDLMIEGVTPAGEKVRFPVHTDNLEEVDYAHQLWARESFRRLNRYDEELTSVSLQFGVLCERTAFVAVYYKDIPGQKPEKVNIPVALPHTWKMESGWGRVSASYSEGSVGAIRCRGAVRSRSLTSQQSDFELLGSPIGFSGEREEELSLATIPQKVSKAKILISEFEGLSGKLLRGKRVSSLAVAGLIQKLSAISIEDWSESEKVQMYKQLGLLVSNGFGVPFELLSKFENEPSDDLNKAIWKEARILLGI